MPFAGTKVPVSGTKVPVQGTKVSWQKDKCFNLYCSINSVEQQLISKKPDNNITMQLKYIVYIWWIR